MIPLFPKFKRLEISDKNEIENFTKHFPPYSDFNFTSLWCWDTYEKICTSQMNNNLIIKFTDYITGESFFSFIGNTNVEETIENLLDLAKKESIQAILKLIPEESCSLIKNNNINFKPDYDNFDYIYLIDELKSYKGNRFGAKRNFVNRFKKNYKSKTIKLNLNEKNTQNEILKMFFTWASRKQLGHNTTKNEYTAISRLFELNNPKIIGIGIYIDEKLASFSINEIVNRDYAILHFEKGDLNSFIGLFPYTMQETARILSNFGIKFLNYEQDLGILGLRNSKLSYNPNKFLKQYTVSHSLSSVINITSKSTFAVGIAVE